MVYDNILTCQYWLGPKVLAKKILAHTNWHKAMYVKSGIKPNKISVIPHCISLERLYGSLKDGEPENNTVPKIILVGRLVKHEGIMELLEVYEQITKKTDAHLLIVGSGPLEGKVNERKKHIERENRKARITFSKRVVFSELICLVNNADIMAIPSYREPFGIIALEAMGLKKAVVTTCFGGISEIITNGVDGILVNPVNKQQFKSSLEELVLNRSKRVKLGNAAYQTVKNKYDVAVVAPKMIRFLDSA
jgi:glycosyltransferase involved in cell wall biosynthesis